MASRKVSFNVRFAITVALLFGITVFVNGILGRAKLGRFDLTEDQIYTISPAAEKVLSELDVPVQVKFYITAKDEMPTGLQTLERDIVDKLNEFRVASDGNLSFAVYDPSKDEELAEKLAAKNIRPFQVQSIDRDEMGIKLVYSSIAVVYKDKDEEIIPQVLPQTIETLEYEICARITKLVRDMDPVIAVYGSKQQLDPQMMQLYMQMGQTPPEPPDLYGQIVELLKRERYDARRVQITADSPIPEEAATLLVLAPRSLSERQRYEINRFVQKGGNLLVAAQGYEYNYQPGRRGGFTITATQNDHGIEPLLQEYGVELVDGLYMDSNMEVLSIPSTQNLGGMQFQMNQPVQAPMQVRVGEGQFNDETSITNSIGQLLFLWGSPLMLTPETFEEHGLSATELFHTSGESWTVDYSAGPLTQDMLTPDPDRSIADSPLAVLLEGQFPNLYPEGDVPRWGDGAAADTLAAEAVEEFVPVDSKVMVVGCSKMFDDNLLGAANNALFVLNAVDALTLGDDLIQIRAKAYTQRVIGEVSDQAKLLWRVFVIGLVPILVAGYGILRTMRRRQEQKTFLAAQA